MRVRLTCVLAAMVALAPFASAQQVVDSDLLPPNAKAGECFTRVWVDPVYETESREVLLKEATERIEIVPAVYETVEETVLVKEASERLELVSPSGMGETPRL